MTTPSTTPDPHQLILEYADLAVTQRREGFTQERKKRLGEIERLLGSPRDVILTKALDLLQRRKQAV